MKKNKLYQPVLLASRPINSFIKEFITSLIYTLLKAPFLKIPVNQFFEENQLSKINQYPYVYRLILAKKFFNIKIHLETDHWNSATIEIESKPCSQFLENLVLSGTQTVSKRNIAKLKEKPIAQFIDLINSPLQFIQDLPIMDSDMKINVKAERKMQISLIDKEKILNHIREAKLALGYKPKAK